MSFRRASKIITAYRVSRVSEIAVFFTSQTVEKGNEIAVCCRMDLDFGGQGGFLMRFSVCLAYWGTGSLHFYMCRRARGAGCMHFYVCRRLRGAEYMHFYVCRRLRGAEYMHFYVCLSAWQQFLYAFLHAPVSVATSFSYFEKDICIFKCSGAPADEDARIFTCAGAPREQDVCICKCVGAPGDHFYMPFYVVWPSWAHKHINT